MSASSTSDPASRGGAVTEYVDPPDIPDPVWEISVTEIETTDPSPGGYRIVRPHAWMAADRAAYMGPKMAALTAYGNELRHSRELAARRLADPQHIPATPADPQMVATTIVWEADHRERGHLIVTNTGWRTVELVQHGSGFGVKLGPGDTYRIGPVSS